MGEAQRSARRVLTLHVLAPAKLNLTLEVLGKRLDGYHEIASIMQTIDLADRISLSRASDIELVVTGPEAHGVPEDPRQDLAYRAAIALREGAGLTGAGARIELEKRIPAGAGLGGGSSDAAAVIRGLNRLWGLGMPVEKLEPVAAALGSDVSFFLHCGTALSRGRGEVIERLPDHPLLRIVLFLTVEDLPDKTRNMFAALSTADFSDGVRTEAAAEVIRGGVALNAAGMCNPFDRVVSKVAPTVGAAMAACRNAGLPVLTAGAGPSFFSPTYIGLVHSSLLSVLESDYGITARACRALSAAEALTLKET